MGWRQHHDGLALSWPPPNVWLGTSIEADRYAWRAERLRQTPAAVRFLSLEPLLGPLPSLDLTGIDWVIVGGESGPKYRPVDPVWVQDLRDRCQQAGIPFFFKQWGGRTPKPESTETPCALRRPPRSGAPWYSEGGAPRR
jgi:protein gp37